MNNNKNANNGRGGEVGGAKTGLTNIQTNIPTNIPTTLSTTFPSIPVIQQTTTNTQTLPACLDYQKHEQQQELPRVKHELFGLDRINDINNINNSIEYNTTLISHPPSSSECLLQPINTQTPVIIRCPTGGVNNENNIYSSTQLNSFDYFNNQWMPQVALCPSMTEMTSESIENNCGTTSLQQLPQQAMTAIEAIQVIIF